MGKEEWHKGGGMSFPFPLDPESPHENRDL